jgi:hypothetical protein
MSRKIDVKLPHEMGDYGDWRERFGKPLLHKKITKEDKNMAVIKADKVANNGNEPVHGKLTKEEKESLDKTIAVFNAIVDDTKRILTSAEQYRLAALACLEILGTDKGKPIVDIMHEQLRGEVQRMLEVEA